MPHHAHARVGGQHPLQARGRFRRAVRHDHLPSVLAVTDPDPAAVVEEFRFLFPGIRTHGREIPFGRDIVEPGLGVIERLCRLPAGGVFLASDDVNDCRFCNYRSACQAVKTDLGALCAASARKIDNPLNTALKPFVELRRDA